MTEKELLEKIKSSAEEIEVPESLSPESIKKKLDDTVQTKKHGYMRHFYAGRKIAAAAVVVFVCGMGVAAVYPSLGGKAGADGSAPDTDMADAAAGDAAVTDMAESAESAEETAAERTPKADAGKMYVVAENYGQIYDLLKEQERERQSIWNSTDGAMKEEAASGGAENVAIAENMDMAVADTAATSGASAAVQNLQAERGDAYTKTNVQTAGVDESDIIKTDGNYLYVVDDNAVKIIDIRNVQMKEVGEIDAPLNSAADRVVEMYVDGDILNLILEKEDTALNTEEGKAAAGSGETEEAVACDVYYVNTNIETELLTYDISNRAKPILKGSTTQDGSYKTSRKVGDVVYLFTEKYLELPNLTRGQATAEDEVGDWIPLVNDIAIAADCIYLPKEGECGLIVSSVNVEKPDTVVDNTLIMNNYVNIYVGTGAIYLYNQDYSGSGLSTQIAKFTFKDGVIDAVGATSAAGAVNDTFAINEYQGKLRLLTTDWTSAEEKNQLYLFDEELKLTGSLTGIATGEQIYAARYLGDMVYFVTYRNTDPLFAVDLSDEKHPKILSELKITGFSEYLHFWGKDKLVGIGYETDPDTGEREGIKLTMFDISDPAKLTTLGTCVLENMDYSPALYDYKCVLADAGENLIGFAAESYGGRKEKSSYLLFSWEDDAFHPLLSESIDGNEILDEYRGIYVGDTFYLVNTKAVTSYDRTQKYQKLENLEL